MKPSEARGIAVVIVILLAVAGLYYWTRDTDGDGTPDRSDAFPSDSTQTSDADRDGHGDNPEGTNPDEFPEDPAEWKDSDNDGVGDNGDAFPEDPTESADADDDGVGDNADIYDQGNGALKLSLTAFLMQGGDFCGTGDVCDPYIILWIDLTPPDISNLDECVDSFLKMDSPTMANPTDLYVVCDAPEDVSAIQIQIRAQDYEGGTIDPDPAVSHGAELDLSSDSSYGAYRVTLSVPFPQEGFSVGTSNLPYAARVDWIVTVVAA